MASPIPVLAPWQTPLDPPAPAPILAPWQTPVASVQPSLSSPTYSVNPIQAAPSIVAPTTYSSSNIPTLGDWQSSMTFTNPLTGDVSADSSRQRVDYYDAFVNDINTRPQYADTILSQHGFPVSAPITAPSSSGSSSSFSGTPYSAPTAPAPVAPPVVQPAPVYPIGENVDSLPDGTSSGLWNYRKKALESSMYQKYLDMGSDFKTFERWFIGQNDEYKNQLRSGSLSNLYTPNSFEDWLAQ